MRSGLALEFVGPRAEIGRGGGGRGARRSSVTCPTATILALPLSAFFLFHVPTFSSPGPPLSFCVECVCLLSLCSDETTTVIKLRLEEEEKIFILNVTIASD